MVKIIYNDCFGGIRVTETFKNEYETITGKELKCSESWFGTQKYDIARSDLDRKDQDMADIVTRLGEDHSTLAIRDLEVGTIYRIDSYDGNEQIITQTEYKWSVA